MNISKEVSRLREFVQRIKVEQIKKETQFQETGQFILVDMKCPECKSNLVFSKEKKRICDLRCTNNKCKMLALVYKKKRFSNRWELDNYYSRSPELQKNIEN